MSENLGGYFLLTHPVYRQCRHDCYCHHHFLMMSGRATAAPLETYFTSVCLDKPSHLWYCNVQHLIVFLCLFILISPVCVLIAAKKKAPAVNRAAAAAAANATVSQVQVSSHLACYWSPRLARSLLFFVVDCLSVCLSVTLLLQIDSSFLFLDGIKPSFGRQFSMTPCTKRCYFDFWFRPPNAQNLLPKICTRSPISRLVWQIDWRCLRLLGGFRGCPIQWIHAKCCGADPCCHGNNIWIRCGDLVAYRLVSILLLLLLLLLFITSVT